MDRKSIIILVISFVVLVLWFPLTNVIWPPKPGPPPTNTVAGATNRAPSNVVSSTVQSNQATVPRELQSMASSNITEETVVFENERARYTFTSHGGGLKQAELKGYPEKVLCGAAARKATNASRWVDLNERGPAPILAVLGGEKIEGDGVFRLTKIDTGVRAEKTLSNGLVLIKDFQIGSNYLIAATVRLENRSSEPIVLPAQEWIVGTATIWLAGSFGITAMVKNWLCTAAQATLSAPAW